jgi:hypothetical protein
MTRRLAVVWLAETGHKEVFRKNSVTFMIIDNEMELTKNEILATIYILVVCFDMGLPVEIRLIWSKISTESL